MVVADLKISPQLGPLSGLGLPRPVGQTLGGEGKERLRDTGGPGEESSLLLVIVIVIVNTSTVTVTQPGPAMYYVLSTELRGDKTSQLLDKISY